MRCINCNREISQGDKFCPACGAAQYVSYANEGMERKSGSNIQAVIIAMGCVIVVCIIVLTGIIFYQLGERKTGVSENIAFETSMPHGGMENTQVDIATPIPTVPPTPVPTAPPTPIPTPVEDEKTIKKNMYLNEINAIEQYSKANLDTAMTQYDINNQSAIVFEKWDVLLNDVYKYLKTIMSKSEFKALEKEELRWIEEKEAAIKREEAQWEGGTGAPAARNMTGITYTRERCYYLVSLIK